jgi:hypothetical protein
VNRVPDRYQVLVKLAGGDRVQQLMFGVLELPVITDGPQERLRSTLTEAGHPEIVAARPDGHTASPAIPLPAAEPIVVDLDRTEADGRGDLSASPSSAGG